MNNRKIQIKSIIYLFAIVFFSFSLSAQEDLSLFQSISKGLENNYSIQIIQMNEQIASLNNKWGSVGRYPSISLNASSNNKKDVNEADNFIQNRYSGSIDLNWLLFNGFSVNISKQRLNDLDVLAKGNSAVMIENTIQGIILTYYRSLLEKEKLEVIEQLMQLSKDRYQREIDRKETGVSVTYDVLQAQNSYLEDKSNYLKQKVNYKNILRNLNYLMGEDITKSYTPTESFLSPDTDYTLSNLMDKMLAENKTLLNQYIYQSLLKKDIALAKSNLYPSLSVRSGIEPVSSRMDLASAPPTISNSYSIYGNLTLSYNLFNGGVTQRAIKIAKIQEEIGQTETKEIVHSLTNELINMFEWYEVYKELVNIAEEALRTAKLNLEISEEKFKTGAINSFNFRDVQQIYLNAAINRLNAIYDLQDAHTSLLRITGGIISEFGE